MTRTWTLVLALAAAGSGLGLLALPRSAVAEDPAPAEKPAYVGPETCKKCHLKQFKSWKTTPMAKSIEALRPQGALEKKKAAGLDPAVDYTHDAKCLKCHTTGYGTATGYPAYVEGKAWTPEEQARADTLSGTTCEACHGAGSLYAPYKKDHEKFKLEEIQRLGATSPPKQEQCMACHVMECPTMPKDYAFDFEKAKKSKDVHEHLPLKYEH
jgi:hypothetical protein